MFATLEHVESTGMTTYANATVEIHPPRPDVSAVAELLAAHLATGGTAGINLHGCSLDLFDGLAGVTVRALGNGDRYLVGGLTLDGIGVTLFSANITADAPDGITPEHG